MDIVKFVNDIFAFAPIPRCFTVGELSGFADPHIGFKTLRAALHNDTRFIILHSSSPEDERFILDSTLFHFFSQLNIRLARIREFKLSEEQITHALNHLRGNGRWDSLPLAPIQWGQSLGLIQPCWADAQYVFPLAKMLSFLKPRFIDLASSLLVDLRERTPWQLSLKEVVENYLNVAFSPFSQKIAYTVKARSGLLGGKKMTLEQVGNSLNCTREYARQIENKFWVRVKGPSYRKLFLKVFLCDFFHESGSRVVSLGSSKANLRTFLMHSNFIPWSDVSRVGIRVLGATSNDFIPIISPDWFPNELETEAIAERLERESQVALSKMDVEKIAGRVSRYRKKRLTRTQMAYLSLRTIGRPAHFSEISDVHNSLWPDLASSEHNIHAALGREQNGVVWIGIKGTYALKEWGYERPKMGLFDAVTEIVQKKYEETGMPVPFLIINAEIGKYRKIINPTSLFMAAHFNSSLRRVDKNSFVPKDPYEEVEDKVSLDELDKIFRNFQDKAH